MFNTTQRSSWLSPFLAMVFLGLMTLLSGCGGGGVASNPVPAPLDVSPSTAVAYNGHPVTLYVTGGTKPYYVTSSNSAVITVPYDVADSTIVFDPSNVSEDTTVTLGVRDSTGSTFSSTITVKPSVISNTLTVTPIPENPGSVACGSAVCSGMMASVSVQLKNMSMPLANRNVRFDVVQGDYQFVTNANATTFASSITSTTDQMGFAFVRLKANTDAPTQYAILKVTDIDGGSSLQTSFTIAQYTNGTGTLSVVPDTQTIQAYWKGTCSDGIKVDYIIHGGTPPYTVQSTSTNVATVFPNTVLTNGAGFTATTQSGFCPGTATIDIKDATGRIIQAKLENKEGTEEIPTVDPVAFFTTAPATVTVRKGAKAIFAVGGGSSPYYVSSSDLYVATVSISGSEMTITGVNAGTATVTVMDSSGASKTVTVTVDAGEALKANPDSVTLSASIPSASVAITGGTAPYSVTSSAPGVATAAITASTVTITRVAAGTASVTVTDLVGGTVTISVTSN